MREGDAAGGAALTPAVRAAVEEARARPPKFASLSNLAPASRAELRAAPMPHLEPVRLPRAPAPRNGVPPPPGTSGRPVGNLHMSQLFLPGVFERIERWTRDASAAMRRVASGEPARPPPTLIVPQTDFQPWARGVIWDCRTPTRCVPVVPSTRDTPDVCGMRINRARLRALAAELGWGDHDLLGQAGEGGLESRSGCSLDMVLSFHHLGAIEHFGAANKIISGDVAKGLVVGPFGLPPFAPTRALPRNVVFQTRSRVLADKSVEDYEKPRVTTNSSDGEGGVGSDGRPMAVNEAVPLDERAIVLPTVRQFGRGAAVVDEAGAEDGLHAELYVCDLSSAFRFTAIQVLDWWEHVFLWIDLRTGEVGYFVDPSGAFGGSYMPQRFERITMLAAAGARTRQDEFDAAHPYPPGTRAWQAERAERQARGELPAGPEQLRPAHVHMYIDDAGGSALNDSVPVPPRLAAMPLGADTVVANGGTPCATDSRASVHLRLAIELFEWLGFIVEVSKTECGDTVISLGFRVSVASRRIDCPSGKQRVLLRDLQLLRAAATAPAHCVDQASTERLTGRLANLAHALPELAPFLVGGYAVASARLPPGRSGARRRLGEVRLRVGSRCYRAVLELCDVSSDVLGRNDGIALAAAASFAALDDTGTLTTVSDASGEDGAGGFAFHADAPGLVWLLAESWPADVRAALAEAASRRADRHDGAPACSMPLAEAFVPFALGAMVQSERPVSAAVSVVDCAPASCALSAGTSAGAQLRALVRAARRNVRHWLAVAVPREMNQDADTLSHPARWREVAESAQAAGLSVRRLGADTGGTPVPAELWDELRSAMSLPMGREAARWAEQGELQPVPRRVAAGRRRCFQPRPPAARGPERRGAGRPVGAFGTRPAPTRALGLQVIITSARPPTSSPPRIGAPRRIRASRRPRRPCGGRSPSPSARQRRSGPTAAGPPSPA